MTAANDIVLFQGDSITDAGRDRNQPAPNLADGLGRGYALLAAAVLLSGPRGANYQVFNRGIGGQGIVDLRARWQDDCLALKPTVLSILAGINDVVPSVNSGQSDRPCLDKFEHDYGELLHQTRRSLPGVRLILCEPFALRCGKVKDTWLPICAARGEVTRRLAGEFGATFIAFQSAFDDAMKHNPKPESWAYDGVHPTVAGHGLMARCWLEGAGYLRKVATE